MIDEIEEEEEKENIADMMPEDFLDLLSATPPTELIATHTRADLAVAAEGAAELFYGDEESDRKKFARLLDLTNRLVKGKEKTHGLNLANSYYCLASFLYRLKEYEEAANLASLAVTTRLGSGSEIAESSALHDYFLLVNALCWSKQFEEAKKHAAALLELSGRVSGQTETYPAEIHLLQARIFEQLNNIGEAEQEFLTAVEIHNKAKSKNQTEAEGVYASYAEFLKRRGRDTEAEEIKAKASAIKAK